MQNQHTRELISAQNTYEDVPLVEFMYLVFTHKPGESYCRWLRSLLLYLCYIFCTMINSLVCWFYMFDSLTTTINVGDINYFY